MEAIEVLYQNRSLITGFNSQIKVLENRKKIIYFKDILKKYDNRINRKKVLVGYLKDQINKAIAELIKSEKY